MIKTNKQTNKDQIPSRGFRRMQPSWQLDFNFLRTVSDFPTELKGNIFLLFKPLNCVHLLPHVTGN